MRLPEILKLQEVKAGGPGSGRRPGDGAGLTTLNEQTKGLHSHLGSKGFKPAGSVGSTGYFKHDNGSHVTTHSSGKWWHSTPQPGGVPKVKSGNDFGSLRTHLDTL
jgi:hypothetical protein